MEKTRLGIAPALLCAAVWFSCFFSGYVAAIILTGYVLLCEQDDWLRKNSVKAVILMVLFSIASAVVLFLPNLISAIDGLVGLFDGRFSVGFVSRAASALNGALTVAEKVMFIFFGFISLKKGTINVPFADKIINKYM